MSLFRVKKPIAKELGPRARGDEFIRKCSKMSVGAGAARTRG